MQLDAAGRCSALPSLLADDDFSERASPFVVIERVRDFVERENAINNRPQAVHCDGPIHGNELRATAGGDDANRDDNELSEALLGLVGIDHNAARVSRRGSQLQRLAKSEHPHPFPDRHRVDKEIQLVNQPVLNE